MRASAFSFLCFCGLVWIWISGSVACLAERVTLQLRNGDRLTGELISLSSTEVAITNTLLGKLSIPVSQVQRLERQQSANSESKPTADLAVRAIPASNPATAQATPTDPPPAPAAASIGPKPASGQGGAPPATVAAPAATQPKPKAPRRWQLEAQVGLDLQYNQKHRQLYYGRAKWTYGKDRFRSIVDYLANYGKTDGVLSANDMTGSVRLEVDLARAKRLYLYNVAGAGYNEVRKIDLSYEESLGIGYKFITLTNFIYSMDLGANHQEQFFSDGTRRDYQALRVGEQLSWRISSKLALDQKFEYYPRWTRFEDYRLRFEANLRYVLLPNITLNLTAIDLHDTQPAPGVSRNDLLLRASVGVKF
jgi:hypothetical protein